MPRGERAARRESGSPDSCVLYAAILCAVLFSQVRREAVTGRQLSSILSSAACCCAQASPCTHCRLPSPRRACRAPEPRGAALMPAMFSREPRQSRAFRVFFLITTSCRCKSDILTSDARHCSRERDLMLDSFGEVSTVVPHSAAGSEEVITREVALSPSLDLREVSGAFRSPDSHCFDSR